MASLCANKHQAPCQTSVLSYLHQRVYKHNQVAERHLVRNRLAVAKSLYRKDLVGHFGCVNAIEFTNGTGEWIVSGGDDRRVLVWNVQKALSGRSQPVIMKGQHNSNIFCLSFDMENKRIFSGGNDEQVIYHDFETGATLDVFRHDDVVYGLSVDPNNSKVFASAADDGFVRIFDVRDPDPFVLADCTSAMHAVMYNPTEPRLLVTANNVYGAALWDIRKPKKFLLKYDGDFGRRQPHYCMSVRLNSLGTQLIALYRKRPLMLYNINSPNPVCKFSSSVTEYSNSCTMKSCSFAGDRDQYVLSGSDSFHVFMWEVPNTDIMLKSSSLISVYTTHMLLKGHRSIVNQVRYSTANHLLVSSGVEKIVKVWSPFPIPGGQGDLLSDASQSEAERERFTQEQYMNIMLRQEMMHDYSNGDVAEDPHMMAFFDSLIAAGDDPWSSDEEPLGLYDIFMSSETSSDSGDPQRDGVVLSPEQSPNRLTDSNNVISSESASNTTYDDSASSSSDTDHSDASEMSNSETGDSEDSGKSEACAPTSVGPRSKESTNSVMQGEREMKTHKDSTLNHQKVCASTSKNSSTKVCAASNNCDIKTCDTPNNCSTKPCKCDTFSDDRDDTKECRTSKDSTIDEPPNCNLPGNSRGDDTNSSSSSLSNSNRPASNGNVLKSDNNLLDRSAKDNVVRKCLDNSGEEGTTLSSEVNGNVCVKPSTSSAALDNKTVVTESSVRNNTTDFKKFKKHKGKRHYRRKNSHVSSEDDDA